MRHKELRYEETINGERIVIFYNDTYADKTITEVCEPFGVEYYTMNEVYVDQTPHRSRWRSIGDHMSINYRPIMAKNGMFFIKRGDRLSKGGDKSYEPKRYKIACGEVLTKDALKQPILGGSIVYRASMRGRSIYHNFYFVRNITDGRGQLVCHEWDRANKKFKNTTSNIGNIGNCIVVDKKQFLISKEIDEIFVPEEY